MQHRHERQSTPSYTSDVTLPWYGYDRSRGRGDDLRWQVRLGRAGRRPAGGVDGSRWDWRWSCWCRCSFSGRFAPHWEPADPSLLRNCRSTPAGGSTSQASLKMRRLKTDTQIVPLDKRLCIRFLTMKAGITGCWNLVLKVCISCLGLAL